MLSTIIINKEREGDFLSQVVLGAPSNKLVRVNHLKTGINRVFWSKYCPSNCKNV